MKSINKKADAEELARMIVKAAFFVLIIAATYYVVKYFAGAIN